jgi:hypothetical protein
MLDLSYKGRKLLCKENREGEYLAFLEDGTKVRVDSVVPVGSLGYTEGSNVVRVEKLHPDYLKFPEETIIPLDPALGSILLSELDNSCSVEDMLDLLSYFSESLADNFLKLCFRNMSEKLSERKGSLRLSVIAGDEGISQLFILRSIYNGKASYESLGALIHSSSWSSHLFPFGSILKDLKEGFMVKSKSEFLELVITCKHRIFAGST